MAFTANFELFQRSYTRKIPDKISTRVPPFLKKDAALNYYVLLRER